MTLLVLFGHECELENVWILLLVVMGVLREAGILLAVGGFGVAEVPVGAVEEVLGQFAGSEDAGPCCLESLLGGLFYHWNNNWMSL